MIKKYLILILITFLLNNPVYSDKNAVYKMGKDDLTHLIAKNSNFKKATDAIKQAKRYAKKGKVDKAKKRFNDVIRFLILANEENPNETNILNYLGYSFWKVSDFAMAEIYYEQGLTIDPKHIEINENLGKLYIETNRIDRAKERLKVLEDCKCKEFDKLKNLVSKY